MVLEVKIDSPPPRAGFCVLLPGYVSKSRASRGRDRSRSRNGYLLIEVFLIHFFVDNRKVRQQSSIASKELDAKIHINLRFSR